MFPFSLLVQSRYWVRYREQDFKRFNDREDEIKSMQSQYKQMQMRLESMEGVQAEMEDNARYYRLFLIWNPRN
jgi:hypothetical protein